MRVGSRKWTGRSLLTRPGSRSPSGLSHSPACLEGPTRGWLQGANVAGGGVFSEGKGSEVPVLRVKGFPRLHAGGDNPPRSLTRSFPLEGERELSSA